MPDPTALPLILVVGPTASGKSALSIHLAESLGGEIVSADAMAVYRGMDIGTAKPDAATLARVPHHLINVFEPEERCDVSRWLTLAEQAIADIHQRGKTPIIAGGTPLYTKALVEGLSAGAPRDAAVRAALDARYATDGGIALLAALRTVDPAYADARHANDQRRIVRALEVYELTGQPYSSFHTTDGIRSDRWRTLHIGLQWDRDVLYRRINARTKAMFQAGLIDEVTALADRLSPEAGQAVGYKEVVAYLAGDYDMDKAIELVKRNSRHLAKHQLTWYKRFADIEWIAGDDEQLLDKALNKARAHLSTKLVS